MCDVCVNMLTLHAKYSGSRESKEAIKGPLRCLYKYSHLPLKILLGSI